MLTFRLICRPIIIVFFQLVAGPAIAGTVDSVMVFSRVMKKSLPCTIVLPNAYQSGNARFPVLYLLHGYGGWHSNWILRVPELSALADDFNTIIVCPEGGKNSWYFDSPLLPASQFETFVTKEVPVFIDQQYRTINQREFRAISGLSMGGHGALFIAQKHPETFGMAGSMSGAVNLYDSRGKNELTQNIGDSAGWDKFSVLQMIDSSKASSLKIIFDCGVDDFLLEGNRALHQKLISLKVPHTYIEREGGHNWDYWRRSIKYHLLFFEEQRRLVSR